LVQGGARHSKVGGDAPIRSLATPHSLLTFNHVGLFHSLSLFHHLLSSITRSLPFIIMPKSTPVKAASSSAKSTLTSSFTFPKPFSTRLDVFYTRPLHRLTLLIAHHCSGSPADATKPKKEKSAYHIWCGVSAFFDAFLITRTHHRIGEP